MKKIIKSFAVLMIIVITILVASCQNNTTNITNVTKYSINLENNFEDVLVSTSVVKTIDNAPKKISVEYGKEYEEGLNVYISINNKSEKKIDIAVYLGENIDKTSTISNNFEDNISGIELTNNLKIVVSESKTTTAKLTINEDLSKNSDTAVNKVHAYDPKDKDLRDYSNGEEIALGKKISIFEFNYASPVHFVITHNGNTVVDKYYSTVIDMQKGHDEFFDFVVEGDISITVTNVDKVPGQDLSLHIDGDMTIGWVYVGYSDIHDGQALEAGEQTFTVYPQSMTKNLKVVIKIGEEEVVSEVIKGDKDYTLNVTADVYFTFSLSEEEVISKQYTVTILNNLNDSNVIVNTRTLDSQMQPIDIESGKLYDEGTTLFIQVINSANYKVSVVIKNGNQIIDSTEVFAKPIDDDSNYGGLMGISLNGNYVIEVNKVNSEDTASESVESKEEVNSYNVVLNNETGCSVIAFYGLTDLENGKKIEAGTYDFTIGASYQELTLVIELYVGDTLVGSVEIAEWDEKSKDLTNVTVNGNVTINVLTK